MSTHMALAAWDTCKADVWLDFTRLGKTLFLLLDLSVMVLSGMGRAFDSAWPIVIGIGLG